MNHTITSQSLVQTLALGEQIAKRVEPGMSLCLIGDLGTGKTFLTKGIAQGLGIVDDITSPTFVLLRQYTIPPLSPLYQRGDTRGIVLNHIDLYRIKGDIEALGFGLDELMNQNSITIIEWAECLDRLLPNTSFTISFRYINETTREITIPEQLYGACK
jgi:tRNA threonylcarbamoyladenosine biosynthesis protein TsaE